MEAQEKKTIWDLLENPPAYAEGVAELISWSMNYDWKNRPYLIFLDLIGYSEDEYGAQMITKENSRLDFVSMSKMADALNEYATRPYDIKNFIEQINEAEDNE